jgi:hypothetical protein
MEPSVMNQKELAKKRQELIQRQELENFESNLNRARAITVGTAFGGTTEIMMRGDGGKHMWCTMQPVEVIELIHQLSANVGCHISMKPRDDFSSWRDWRVSELDKQHLNGHTPFVNDMAVFQQLGSSGFNQKEAEALMNFIAAQKANTKLAYNELNGEDAGTHTPAIHDNQGQEVYKFGGRGGNNADQPKKSTPKLTRSKKK